MKYSFMKHQKTQLKRVTLQTISVTRDFTSKFIYTR